jgi:hypothetical protein
MSDAHAAPDSGYSIPTAHLLPLPAPWVDGITEHCEDVKCIRMLFARSTRDELSAPVDMDDFHLRLQEAPRADGQGKQWCFDVEGLGLYHGPRQLAEFLWAEGQEHYRAVCSAAGRDGDQAPRRLRIVAQLLDGQQTELDQLGGYTGMNPRRGAAKRAEARGISFTEDHHDEPIMPGPGRINQSLEKGYLTMMKRVDGLISARIEDSNGFVKASYERANEYHAKVANQETEGDMDDEIIMAALALGNTVFGEKKKRNEKSDDIKDAAPDDGGAGGPACAYAREALTHFDADTIAACKAELDSQAIDNMVRCLRYSSEPNCQDAKLLKDFKKCAEWFIAQYQKDPQKLARTIPRGAAVSLDALLKLALA